MSEITITYRFDDEDALKRFLVERAKGAAWEHLLYEIAQAKGLQNERDYRDRTSHHWHERALKILDDRTKVKP